MTVFALESLFDAVKAHMDGLFAAGLVPVVWGRLEPQQQLNRGTVGRVVLVPNAPDGSIGPIEDPEQPGRDPKPLYSHVRKFHFLIWGQNPTFTGGTQDKSRADDHVVELLLHEVCRAVYLATHLWGADAFTEQKTSPVVLGEPVVLKPEQQHPFGVEYRLPGTVQSAIVDQYDDVIDWTNAAPLNAETTVKLGTTSRVSETETA